MKITVSGQSSVNSLRGYARGSVNPTHLVILGSRSGNEITSYVRHNLTGQWDSVAELKDHANGYGCRVSKIKV